MRDDGRVGGQSIGEGELKGREKKRREEDRGKANQKGTLDRNGPSTIRDKGGCTSYLYLL